MFGLFKKLEQRDQLLQIPVEFRTIALNFKSLQKYEENTFIDTRTQQFKCVDVWVQISDIVTTRYSLLDKINNKKCYLDIITTPRQDLTLDYIFYEELGEVKLSKKKQDIFTQDVLSLEQINTDLQDISYMKCFNDFVDVHEVNRIYDEDKMYSMMMFDRNIKPDYVDVSDAIFEYFVVHKKTPKKFDLLFGVHIEKDDLRFVD